MLALGALIAFIVGLILDVLNAAPDVASVLMWVGLALVAAHLAFAGRFRRPTV